MSKTSDRVSAVPKLTVSFKICNKMEILLSELPLESHCVEISYNKHCSGCKCIAFNICNKVELFLSEYFALRNIFLAVVLKLLSCLQVISVPKK